MAEYLIQEETLTGIGDKIRILSGTEDTMTPTEMSTALETHNTEITEIVTEQDDLIAQISAVLEGKAVVGGSETVSVTIDTSIDDGEGYPTAVYYDASRAKQVISGVKQTVDAFRGFVKSSGDSQYFNDGDIVGDNIAIDNDTCMFINGGSITIRKAAAE